MIKNKILVVGMSNHRAGIENFLHSYTSRFQNSMVDFISFHDDMAFEKEMRSKGHNILRIPSRKENIFRHYQSLKKIIKKNDYDAVWMNSVNISYMLPIKFAHKYNVPVRIIHAHSSQLMGSKVTKFLHYYNRNKVYKYSTEFWACSTNAGKWMFPKLNAEKIRIVKNAINLKEFQFREEDKNTLKQQLNLENKIIIGTVGRLMYVKNHMRLLSIFNKALKENIRLHLLIAGEGPERKKLEHYIQQNKLEKSVTLLGAVDYIPKVLSVIDLFILPSLFEGLPIVLVEAQATGLKCIVSSSVENEEVIITDLLEFVSLEESDEYWVDIILNSFEYDRHSRTEAVKKSGFDIQIESEKLEQEFFNLKRKSVL